MSSANRSGRAPEMNKKARAKLAKDTIKILIPQILETNERARTGASKSELIRYDPSLVSSKRAGPAPPAKETAQESSESKEAVTSTPVIRVIKSDTFDAAAAIMLTAASSSSTSTTRGTKPARIAVLNMASPLRPGGGVLNGARAQEESLCTRSTLYATLHESYYRIPEDGAVYSPDVLVFRGSSAESDAAAAETWPKKEWFFVDVISCAALRFPETVIVMGAGIETEEKGYETEAQREAMVLKVRLILQIAAAKGVSHLVLGALGCGAYGNPPVEVARIFRKVLCGDRKRKGVTVEKSGIQEIVFAIFDEGENLSTFRKVFADINVGAVGGS